DPADGGTARSSGRNRLLLAIQVLQEPLALGDVSVQIAIPPEHIGDTQNVPAWIRHIGQSPAQLLGAAAKEVNDEIHREPYGALDETGCVEPETAAHLPAQATHQRR